jgi:tetratricopeptide (TPR) repeat protein
MRSNIPSVFVAVLSSFITGCAGVVSNTGPEEFPSTVEVDVANAEPGTFTPDVQQESSALHAFLVGQLSLNQEDFEGALKNFSKADELTTEPAPIIHTKLADLYLRFGELDKALMAAKKAMSEDPSDPHIRLLYAGILESMGRDSEAEPMYRALIEEYPGKFDSYILLSNLYVKQKKFPQAVEVLKLLIARHPKEALGHYYLGRTYEQMGKLDLAEVEYTKVFEGDPALSNGSVELLRVLLRQKKTVKAEALCERILKKDSTNPLARKVLGHLKLGESKLDEALKHLDVLKDLEADPTDTRFKVALIQMEKQNYREAIRELSLVLAKDPKHAEARYYLASIYAGTGKYKEAIEELNQIQPDSPMYVKSRTFAALILRQQEELGDAREAVEDALAVEPENKNLILYRILILRDQEEYKEAEAQVRAALAKEPNDERFLFNLALVLHERGQDDEALAAMERVVEVNPSNSDALNYIAYELAEKGQDLPRAEDLVRRALHVRPNDGFYLDTLGWIQYKQGKLADAEQTLARAISASGDDLVIVDHYILILIEQNKNAKAVGIMKGAIERPLSDDQLKDSDRAAAYERIKRRLREMLRAHPDLESVEKTQLDGSATDGQRYSALDGGMETNIEMHMFKELER